MVRVHKFTNGTNNTGVPSASDIGWGLNWVSDNDGKENEFMERWAHLVLWSGAIKHEVKFLTLRESIPDPATTGCCQYIWQQHSVDTTAMCISGGQQKMNSNDNDWIIYLTLVVRARKIEITRLDYLCAGPTILRTQLVWETSQTLPKKASL